MKYNRFYKYLVHLNTLMLRSAMSTVRECDHNYLEHWKKIQVFKNFPPVVVS